MRYTLALVALVVGCSPAAVPHDAPPPDSDPAWVFCPEQCRPTCSVVFYDVTCADVGTTGTDCSECEALCAFPPVFTDADVPSPLGCEPDPITMDARWVCDGEDRGTARGVPPVAGRCFRRRR